MCFAGIDEDAVKALQACTQDQCHDIAAHFDSIYSHSLLEAFQEHCQPRTAFIALILIRGVCEAAAFYLNNLLDVMMPKPEITLVEIICGQTESQLQQTNDCYLELTENDLSQIIKKKCTPQVAEILEYRIEEQVSDGPYSSCRSYCAIYLTCFHNLDLSELYLLCCVPFV